MSIDNAYACDTRGCCKERKWPKTLRRLIIDFLIAIAMLWCLVRVYRAGYQAGYDYIKDIEEFQQQIGTEPDGKFLDKSVAAWKKAICNKYAVEAFEPVKPTEFGKQVMKEK